MAASHRRSSPDLNSADRTDIVQDILAEGRAFSFFQAIRLLRHKIRGQSAGIAKTLTQDIKVRPKLSLSFPAADIDRIEQLDHTENSAYRITASFLGLYGSDSPLPTFYTEDLLNEASHDESVSRDFIDIFNQRLYELLFQGWLKYRLFLQVAEEKNNAHVERLFCLLGLGSEELRRGSGQALPDYSLLRYIGLLTQFPRSATGLATLLSDALRDVPLRIMPCIPRKAEIPAWQRLRVGLSGNRLGADSYLGQEIDDRMGKFRIEIGPLAQEAFLQFTPGHRGHSVLTQLIDIYVTEPLAYEVELILAAGQARTVRLGDPVCAALGVTAWVFSEARLGEVRTRFSVNRT